LRRPGGMWRWRR